MRWPPMPTCIAGPGTDSVPPMQCRGSLRRCCKPRRWRRWPRRSAWASGLRLLVRRWAQRWAFGWPRSARTRLPQWSPGRLVAWSPGIQPADPALLDQVCAAQVPLTDPRPRTPAAHAFWAETIHPDGFRALCSLFQVVATDPPWQRVRCPVLLGDYRAADGREDATASVPAMLDMFVALGTAPAHKLAIAFDSGAHAIGSPHKTPLADAVAQASVAFLQEQLGAAPQTGNA